MDNQALQLSYSKKKKKKKGNKKRAWKDLFTDKFIDLVIVIVSILIAYELTNWKTAIDQLHRKVLSRNHAHRSG